MALKINWSKEAKTSYENILIYLTLKWSVKDADNFIEKTDLFLETISEQPYAFPSSKYDNIRKAVVTKQTSLIYLVRELEIELLMFWDNRMNPMKNKF